MPSPTSSPLPTRKNSTKTKRGITLVHDTPYEAAYSAFRQALQAHVGEGKPCWVDAADLDIDTHEGNDATGSAAGSARFKTLSDDGQRIAPKCACAWTVKWELVLESGLPTTKMTSYTLDTTTT
jgi:hypothetical protein